MVDFFHYNKDAPTTPLSDSVRLCTVVESNRKGYSMSRVMKFVPRIAVLAAIVLAGLALLPNSAAATEAEFEANIDEPQEINCAEMNGNTGFGTFKLNKTTGELSFNFSFTGLSSPQTDVHIHGPAGPGVNAGVVRGLPLGSPSAGTVVPDLTAQEIADMQAGLYYINIHSENCLGGELRGQILPASVGGTALGGPLQGLGGDDSGTAWWIVAAAMAGLVALAGGAVLSLRHVRNDG